MEGEKKKGPMQGTQKKPTLLQATVPVSPFAPFSFHPKLAKEKATKKQKTKSNQKDPRQ